MATYARLFPATTQFILKNGMLNVAGLLHIFEEGTDDAAEVYDTDGSLLQQPVMLDNDGRAPGLFVDASKTYWMRVCNRNDNQIYTVRRMSPSGGAGGALVGSYSVISSDGTVDVSTYGNAGSIVFDLSTHVENSESKWGGILGSLDSVTGDGNWETVPVVTSDGSVEYSNGWTATKDCVADIAASLEMISGDAIATYMLDVMCVFYVDGTAVSTEYGHVDPSEAYERLAFEFKGAVNEGQVVDCRISVKGQESMSPALVSRAYYNEECDGIVGGNGGGGGSYIPGQYIDISGNVISVTGVQPAGNYVYNYEISGESANWNQVSAKEDKVNWGVAGGNITSINGYDIAGGSPYSAGEYVDISSNVISVTGVQPVSAMSSYVEQSAFDSCCSAMSGYVSSLQGDVSSISSIVSSISGQTGDFVEKSSISAESATWNTVTGKQDSGDYLSSTDSSNFILTSQSGMFQPSGYYQPSGSYLSSTDSSLFVQASAISAESATWNEVSAKLDESAFTSYTATASQFTGVTTDSSLTGDGTLGNALGVNKMDLVFDSSMTTSMSGDSALVGVNTAILSGFAYQSALSAVSADVTSISSTVSGLTGTYIEQSASGMFQPSGNYLDSTASSEFLSTSQSSLFQPSGNYLPASASGDFFTGVHTDTSMTGNGMSSSVLGVKTMEVLFDTATMSTSMSGETAVVNVKSSLYQPRTAMTGYVPVSAISAQSSDWNNVSAKLDASASSEFYPTSNPSGFVTDLSDYQLTADMSSYQQTSAMSAYALSADVSGCIDTVSTNSASWAAVTLPITGSIGADSAIYGETSVEFIRNDTAGEPDIRTATLTPDSLNITYTVDNNDFYSVNVNETGIEFSDPNDYYTLSPYEITTWNSASDAVANNSATWDGVTAKQDASAMSAYQEISGMTAYQPVGTYIYESALGWAEV